MALTIGSQLGFHEITALLGKGGMGEVYRARDLKLKREVAIKILPEEFSSDLDRISRFQREAEVLAALNHPNIAAIYDVQEASGSRYLVLELVEGETLADRIARGRIPVEEALDIAKSICEALEAAHEKGIIHRDLKPANVKITPDGKVKVLDFGLAKAISGSAPVTTLSNSPTLLSGSIGGMIVGTAAYMSPEQARGHNADQRSDIFSFGCVLYEMLTGEQAFKGEEVSDVLASVLAREPDVSLLPEDLNPRLLDFLRRSLEKNRKRRWHCVGDLRSEMEFIEARKKIAPVVEQSTAKQPAAWKRTIPLLIAVAFTAAITGAAVWNFKPSPVPNIARFSIALGEGQQIVGLQSAVAISPDGTQIVYDVNRRLYHRWLSEFEARPIPGSENFDSLIPVFSPDGRSIAFGSARDTTIKTIAVSGGVAVPISPFVAPYAISWGAEGILFTGKDGIMRVTANGGKPELLVGSKAGEVLNNPQMLPDRDAILFTVAQTGQTTGDNSKIVVQRIRSGERKTVREHGGDARYVPTGHIVYFSGGTLFALPFDLKRLEATGGPVPVIEGVRRVGNLAAQYSFSNTGSLIYAPGPISGGDQRALAVVDRKGVLETLKAPPLQYNFIRLSPDGKLVAFESDGNIWIYDVAGSIAPRQLTTVGSNHYPVWTTNGERVAFQSNREGDSGIFWQRADGAGIAERLTKPEQGVAHIPDSWSRDGQNLSFTAVKGDEAAVWILSIKEKKAAVFAQAPSASLHWSAFSPDGSWLAYQSNEMKKNQVWVQPFPNTTGAKYPIVDGGQPFWSSDGKELFFNPAPATISVVSITTRPSFTWGPPTVVERGIGMGSPTAPRTVDIMRDGRFIAAVNADQNQSGAPIASQFQVVLNWFEELKQRVPVH